MLRKSPPYTRAMEGGVPPVPENLKTSFVDVLSATTSFRPRTQAAALVEASEPSQLQQAGAGGDEIATGHVDDILHGGPVV